MTRKILTLVVAAAIGFGGVAVANTADAAPRVAPSVMKVMKVPAEDSKHFDCRKHGKQRTCGVRLDPTPNNGKNDAIWYVLDFKTKTFKKRSF